jgi:D-alanine-D-alanine ligase
LDIVLIKSYTGKPWRGPETFQLIENALAKKWTVHSISPTTTEELHQFILQIASQSDGNVFAYNIAEYLDESTKCGFIPALLDEWKIPHLGSDAEVIATGLDKEKTKNILLRNGISTPRFFIAEHSDPGDSIQAEAIGFPLFVKPLNEGGHIGIGDHSIVKDTASLEREIGNILETYGEPALIEEYICGAEMREFSVGIVDGDERIFTPVEIDYESMDVTTRILSYESAIQDLEKIKLVEDLAIQKDLVELTAKTFNVMGAKDYSRVDIRMNHNGFYVLEINVMPGFGPHSFLPEAAELIHGIRYEELIQRLAEVSMKRIFK